MTKEEHKEFRRIAGLIAKEADNRIVNFAKTIILLKQSIFVAMFLTINSLIMDRELIIYIFAFSIYLILLSNHLVGYLTKCMENILLIAEKKIEELERLTGKGIKLNELENYKQYYQQKSKS